MPEFVSERWFQSMLPRHRRYPRIETSARLDYTGPHEVLLDHHIVNISLGGMAIRAPAVEPVGTRVDLVIRFPDIDQELELQGEVAWTNEQDPKEMGIRFVEISDQGRELLRRFIYTARLS